MAQDLEKTNEECQKKLDVRICRGKLLVERRQKNGTHDLIEELKGQREKVSDIQVRGQSA